MAVDDLDSFVKWVSKQEPKVQERLSSPENIVVACQWLSKGNSLKEEYFKREKTLKTAIELCGESTEIQDIDKRSQALLKAINVHIAKVEALCVLMSEGKNVNDDKVLSAVCKSGAKGGLTNDEMLEVIPEIRSAMG